MLLKAPSLLPIASVSFTEGYTFSTCRVHQSCYLAQNLNYFFCLCIFLLFGNTIYRTNPIQCIFVNQLINCVVMLFEVSKWIAIHILFSENVWYRNYISYYDNKTFSRSWLELCCNDKTHIMAEFMFKKSCCIGKKQPSIVVVLRYFALVSDSCS